MKVRRLRALMERYPFAGVLFVATYLVLHSLWTKRRNLLLIFVFTLLGFCLSSWRIPRSPRLPPKTVLIPHLTDPKVINLVPPKKAIVHNVPDYDRWKEDLPYHARWGSYQIVIEQKGKEEDGGQQRVRILGHGNEVLHEIRAWAITRVELVKLTGHSPEELHIALWSGGAYASFSDVYFSQKGGLHNILIFDRQDREGWEVVDLNHDGIPEIVAENPVLGDFSAYNFHRHWPVITILGWNGSRYVDVTSRYPSRSLEEAAERQQDIQGLVEQETERREWDFQDKITAYYANMLNIGRGHIARRWLKHHLSSSDWAWVQEHDSELRQIIATAAKRRAYVSHKKVIEQMERPTL